MDRFLFAMRRGNVASLALMLFFGFASPVDAAERSYAADLHYELGARALRQADGATAVEQLARAVELAPDDPAVLGLYARALLLEERPAEAEAVLEDLRHIEPSAPDLDLLLGLAHSRLGEWRAAREHLEAARDLDPGNSRVRLFLGIAYQELGEDDKAEAELREAYKLDPALETAGAYRLALLALRENRPDEAQRLLEEVLTKLPGSLLADSAAVYLLRIERGEARRWEVYATVGSGYDTNVNLFGDELFPSGISRENDVFGEAEIGIEGIAWERERLHLRLGYRAALTAYRHENDLDTEANHGWAILSYDLSENLGLELGYDFSWVWVDWDSFRRTNSVEPALRFTPRQDLFTRVFWRYDDRGFFTETVDPVLDRDGKVRTVGIEQYWILPNFRGWGSGFARVSARYRDEDAQGQEYDSHGGIWIVTLGLPLPSETFLTLDGWFEQRHFDHPSLFEPLEGDRDDNITRVRVLLRRALSGRLFVTAGWRYTHWSSNVGAYDFDRAVSDIRFTYRY